MIKDIEEQKMKLKEKMNKEIDRYFEEFEKGSEQEGFNIDRIEQLMVKQQGVLKKVMNEANDELTGSIDANVKKNAQNAEMPLKEQKQTKKSK